MSDGIITTFYSYKGGVGRSFALANAAAAISSWGYRVLCIDWDLDAPGLRHYFRMPSVRSGLVDLIRDVDENRGSDWTQHLAKVTLTDNIRFDFLDAGTHASSYIDCVQHLNWVHLYEKRGLADIIETWRHQWKQSYDVILIDSRTGVTDIGALCTAVLPDILVGMFTATDQSLDGCLEVLRRAQRARETISFDRPALLTVPVVSKFDAREEYKRAQQWRDKFASALPPFYSSWASKEVPLETLIARTTIPYAAYWSFGEELAVLIEPPQTTDSVRFYLETLAALIAQSLSNTELLVDAPERFIAAANRAGLTRAGYRYDLFLDGTPDVSQRAMDIARGLESHGLTVFNHVRDPAVTSPAEVTTTEALTTSQNAVFLLGNARSSEVEMRMRVFAKQLLEEGSDRRLLPLAYGDAAAPSMPPLLRNSVVRLQTETTAEAVIQVIRDALVPARTPLRPLTTPEYSIAMAQAKSNDPLARRVAATVLGRINAPEAFYALIEMLGDKEAIVRDAVRTTLQAIDHATSRSLIQSHDVFAQQLNDLVNRGAIDHTTSLELQARLGNTTIALEALLTLLSDQDSQIRYNAAVALGRLRNPIATEWLLARLNDSDPKVVRAVANALCSIDDPRSVQGIVERAREADPRGAAVCRALQQSADQHYIDRVLAEIFRLRERTNDVDALYALVVKIESPVVIDALARDIHLARDSYREFVVNSLARFEDPRAKRMAAGFIDDASLRVRRAAMRAALQGNLRPSTDHIIERLRESDHNSRLLAIDLASKSGDPRTIEALADLTRNDNGDVAYAAIDALASIGAPALEFLEAIIDSGSTHTANKAIAALGTVKSARTVDFLLDRLRTPDFARKDKVIEVLGVIGDPRAIEGIETYLTNESEMLRESAARSLGAIRDARAVNGLRRLLLDPVSIVRLSAIDALGLIADERSADDLVSLTQDADAVIRRAAVGALGRIRRQKDITIIAEHIVDKDVDMRIVVAGALANIGGDAALKGLLRLFADKEQKVRVTACEKVSGLLGREREGDLLCRDVDMIAPWIDPNTIIGDWRLDRIANVRRISRDDAKRLYERLNARLQRKLKLSWIKPGKAGEVKRTSTVRKPPPATSTSPKQRDLSSETGPLVREESIHGGHGQSGGSQNIRSTFLGKWETVAVRNSPSFVLTLDESSDAHKSHLPNVRGQWEILGGEAHITWTDGWLDILQPQSDGSMLKTAYGPEVDRSGPPTNSQLANRI